MKFEKHLLPDVTVFVANQSEDHRGTFFKTFHEGFLREMGIAFEVREEFFSRSRRGVVRGMHFQVPPEGQGKIVSCLAGAVLDVVVDIRRGSPTYGHVAAIELSEGNRRCIHIPVGFAHGFVAVEEPALMHYKCDRVHSAAHDRGIRWDTISFDWPVNKAVISSRDESFPSFEAFDSPFAFEARR